MEMNKKPQVEQLGSQHTELSDDELGRVSGGTGSDDWRTPKFKVSERVKWRDDADSRKWHYGRILTDTDFDFEETGIGQRTYTIITDYGDIDHALEGSLERA